MTTRKSTCTLDEVAGVENGLSDYFRGRSFRVYSPLDSGVVDADVGVFRVALLRAFFGGVWTVSLSGAAVVLTAAAGASAALLSTSMGCSSAAALEALPFGEAFGFFEALTEGDDEATRLRPPPAEARAPLRGDGVRFLLFLPTASSSSSWSSSSASEGTASLSAESFASSVEALTARGGGVCRPAR